MPKYTGTETSTYLGVKASDVERPNGGGLTSEQVSANSWDAKESSPLITTIISWEEGDGVILPMSVLMFKMSLPKMIILFDDYNGRHYPVEVKIIQLPKKLDGELTNGLSTKISINALFWLKPGKLKRIPCIPQMLQEVKKDVICSRLITSLY